LRIAEIARRTESTDRDILFLWILPISPRRNSNRANVSANDDLDANALEDFIEGPVVLGISIVNEILATVEKSDVDERHFSGDLIHDVFGGRWRDHREVDFPRPDVNEKEYVEGAKSAVLPDLLGEEIGRSQDILVRCDEIMPGRSSKALGRRLDTGFLQDVLDGRPADVMSEVSESTGEACIAPARVFSCSSKDHFANLFGRRRAANRSPAIRCVELLRDQPSMPAENRIWRDNCRDLTENLSAEWLAEFSESPTFAIVQLDPAFDLLLEDLVFGFQEVDFPGELLIELA